MLTEKDHQQIKEHGISIEQVEQQIAAFKAGFPFVNLISPAKRDDGIHAFDEKRLAELRELYKDNSEQFEIIKFVPASGGLQVECLNTCLSSSIGTMVATRQ